MQEEVELEKEEDKPIEKNDDEVSAPPLPQDTLSPVANGNEADKDAIKNDSSKEQNPAAERRQSDISYMDTS